MGSLIAGQQGYPNRNIRFLIYNLIVGYFIKEFKGKNLKVVSKNVSQRKRCYCEVELAF